MDLWERVPLLATTDIVTREHLQTLVRVAPHVVAVFSVAPGPSWRPQVPNVVNVVPPGRDISLHYHLVQNCTMIRHDISIVFAVLYST